MTNKEIAHAFRRLGEMMELHQENTFKIRSYQNAYLTLRKQPTPLAQMSTEEIAGLKGVGKAISEKIKELLNTGQMATFKKYEEITPPGVREMLEVPGIGPKKIRAIWKDLGIESVGELAYACNENRLIELSGFGQKTQEDLKQKLSYYQKSKGKFLFPDLEEAVGPLIAFLKKTLPSAKIQLTGAIRRCSPVLESIEVVIASNEPADAAFSSDELIKTREEKDRVWAKAPGEIPVVIYRCPMEAFGSKLFRYSAGGGFMEAFLKSRPSLDFKNLPEEIQVFEKAGLPFVSPELREEAWSLHLAETNRLPVLIKESDIRGVVHSHSTYSDGLQSLAEMANACMSKGYKYLGISDHSKSAFYANGLKEEQVQAQWKEIDELNGKLAPFRILKGIESDILYDGALDYEDAILEQFEFVIASVHSILRMDEEKATSRLIAAIENPHTTILGHPTGRLLLSRQGYPINHKKVIAACAANNVAIELNANPYRLDIDWTWIPYAVEQGAVISINPDAHSSTGIDDIHYGVLMARKGGLTAAQNLSSFTPEEFLAFARKP
ncbi:MAG: DNA polymerase/3'-5' exonuclease PolX [Saprospiraceae bacterium]|nr:MAG: DNA polymerase/3'-5' exonuclease PolX [Saprospiraceae bacterium]